MENIGIYNDTYPDPHQNPHSLPLSYASLHDALAYFVSNSNAANDGKKVIVFLTSPISFHIEENIDFSHTSNSESATLKNMSKNSNSSFLDHNDEKENRKKAKRLTSWLFILSGHDSDHIQTKHLETAEEDITVRNLIKSLGNNGKI